MSSTPKRRPGRPSGSDGVARDAIATAARRQFSLQGFDGPSLRRIAAEAGVDPSLVKHYFGDKQRLFLSVVDLPVDDETLLPRLMDGSESGIGDRLASIVAEQLNDPDSRSRLLGLLRAASSHEKAAAVLRERLTEALLEPLAASLGRDEPRLRAAMVMSQVVGLVVARHIVQLEPLARADLERLARLLAPVLQHYLTADLFGPPHEVGDAGGTTR
ncbi:MAG: TetR family transcriptional regulator [Ornithinimicrobium sp.]